MPEDVQGRATAPFLTISDVARILAVSGRTVRRLIDAKRLGAIRTSASTRAHLRVPRTALDEFVKGASVDAVA